MINIISRSYYSRIASGPKKVANNLIKGLDLIGYPYVINKGLDTCRRLWIHDDVAALRKMSKLPSEVRVVIGPNLFVLPRQIPKGLDLSKAVYIQPSVWAKDFWERAGFKACQVAVWPVGVDTEEFRFGQPSRGSVMVYFKQRSKEELRKVKAALESRRLPYRVMSYGSYSEGEYKQVLSQSRYAVWLGMSESQGLALEEALAANVPMVVCDAPVKEQMEAIKKRMNEESLGGIGPIDATSAPYFDERCGLKIKGLGKLEEALETIESHLSDFHPREYVLENLTLEKQAREFVEIFRRYHGLPFEEGLSERPLKEGEWDSGGWVNRTKFVAKDLFKSIFR